MEGTSKGLEHGHFILTPTITLPVHSSPSPPDKRVGLELACNFSHLIFLLALDNQGRRRSGRERDSPYQVSDTWKTRWTFKDSGNRSLIATELICSAILNGHRYGWSNLAEGWVDVRCFEDNQTLSSTDRAGGLAFSVGMTFVCLFGGFTVFGKLLVDLVQVDN